ncbi:MAG: cache and HAMP domain-containing protein, partial [Bradymonadaceae bacterium]
MKPSLNFSKEPAPRGLTLAAQIFLLISLMSLLPLLITNITGYLTSRHNIEQLTVQSLQYSAQAVALQSQVFLEEKRAIVPALVAGNRHLQETVARALQIHASGAEANGPSLLDLHLEAKANNSEDVAEFYVLSPHGVLLGSSKPDLVRGTQRRDQCFDAWRSDVDSVMQYGEQAPVFLVAQTVPGLDGEAIGVLCGRFDFSLHHRLPQSPSPDLARTTFHLVNGGGSVIWSSSGLRKNPMNSVLMGHAKEECPWHGLYEDDDGEQLLAAMTPVTGTPWLIVAELPEEKVFASLLSLRRRALGMGGALLLLVTLGMVYTARRIVRPVRDLVQASQAMREGKLHQAVTIRGPAEIAALADVHGRQLKRASHPGELASGILVQGGQDAHSGTDTHLGAHEEPA